MVARMIAEQEAGALAGIYAEIRQQLRLGYVPNVFKAMAAVNTDVLIQNWTAFRYTMLGGELPRALKEMVGLVVARQLGCAYGIELHGRALAALQVAPEIIDALRRSGDAQDLPASTRAALRFARESAAEPVHGEPAALEAAGFSEEEAHEVIDAVLIVSGLCRFATESDVPLD